jgi:hypothetical protein
MPLLGLSVNNSLLLFLLSNSISDVLTLKNNLAPNPPPISFSFVSDQTAITSPL